MAEKYGTPWTLESEQHDIEGFKLSDFVIKDRTGAIVVLLEMQSDDKLATFIVEAANQASAVARLVEAAREAQRVMGMSTDESLYKAWALLGGALKPFEEAE